MNELISTILKREWLLYAACGAAGIGCLIKIILSVIYNRSLSASERMRGTKVPWLRQMKTRYESGYEWNNRIRNAELFVDKNIGRRKCLGIYLKTWEAVSDCMLTLEVLLSVIGAVGVITYIEEKHLAVLYLMTGSVLAVLLQVVSAFANLKEKRSLLRINLCEYFENTLHGEARRRCREEQMVQELHPEYHKQQEEIACAVSENSSDVDESTKLSDSGEIDEQTDAKECEKKEISRVQSRREKRKEKRQEKQMTKAGKKESRRREKQEKRIEKETVKLQRKQRKEQKRVAKLTRRMEKVQKRIGTAASLESMQNTCVGKKEENARLKREQLKKKVEVTPAQEDQIIADVLREFLA